MNTDLQMQHVGSCLCGAVHFKVAGAFEHLYLCHCSRCRKGSGSAHGANLFSTTATLEWVSGRDKVCTYHVPNARHTRCFCAVCGSALPYAVDHMLIVPAGSLDSSLSIKPDAHIFVASRAAWDNALESAPRFDTYPA